MAVSKASAARATTLEQARVIAHEYRQQGLTLTLRQLYYQLVSRAFIDNNHKAYKRLGDILVKARLSGNFPWDMIEDRTRTPHEGSVGWAYTDIEDALGSAASDLREAPETHLVTSRWWSQRKIVCVWVEKEALASVFEKPCQRLGVPWFVCRGYPSLSTLKDWVEQVDLVARVADQDERYREAWGDEERRSVEDGTYRAIEEIVVLYFGDHDPDGFEIPRAAERRIGEIAASLGLDLPPVRFKRVALNMNQILIHEPPPYPAKPSSSRYAAYVAEHDTDDAWELDALNPRALRTLITDEVSALFDREIFATVRAGIADAREEMRNTMTEVDANGDAVWLSGVFA